MGYCAQPTPEMGPYSVEVRGESFVLGGEDNFEVGESRPCPRGGCDVIGDHRHAGEGRYVRRRHAFTLHVQPSVNQGRIEALIEDIPMIRAALDQAERIASGNRRPED